MFDMGSTINKIGRYLLVFVLMLSFIASAQSGVVISSANQIISAMINLCITAKTFLSVGAMLLIVLAAAIYAVGQMLGAETRARASVWATAMITGAVIGIVIYLLVPSIINTMMTGQTTGTVTC